MATTDTRHADDVATDSSVPPRFQILALDGGGAKALFTAQILAHLEDDLGISISEHFDLITGTSAGGIIALALGAGLTPAEIVDHYQHLTRTVFPRSRRRLIHVPRRLVRPTYRQEPLRSSLEGVLGDHLLGDSRYRLVIPSWDAQNGCVHIFKTPHHQRLTRDWKVRMVDVALATSAAPTYLPAAKVDGSRLVDGGVWANNPSVVGIAEAVSLLDVQLEQIWVLNIGTTSEVAHHPPRLDQAGLVGWVPRAVGLIMTAGSRGAEGVAEHLVGQARYHRIDAPVPPGLVTLDDADPFELSGRAADISRKESPTVSALFADHTPTPYQPMHPRRTKESNDDY
jgi:predicted acylesterase/phospholipase RssA